MTWATHRWCAIKVKRREAWDSDEDEGDDLEFVDFLKYLKRHNLISTEKRVALGEKKKEKEKRGRTNPPLKSTP